MELQPTSSEGRFRADVEDWLSTVRRPSGLRDYGSTPTASDIGPAKEWQRILFDAGWAGLTWPAEFGGRGASATEVAIFAELMAAADLPRQLNIVGLELAGPMIQAFGTQTQRDRHLESILKGEHVWCQLFSEPGAGSDLAALTTRAEPGPDGWVLSGQKVWTSGAHYSDFGLVLARTDPSAPSHHGISCFVLPMDRPGIEARPLRQMDGETKFNEVFFDGAQLYEEELLGRPGQGWQIAMSTLGRERLTLGAQAVGLAGIMKKIRCGSPSWDVDPVLRQEWTGLWTRIQLLRITWLRALMDGSPGPGATWSVLKLMASQIQFDVASLGVQAAGANALAGGHGAELRHRFLASPGARIAGGTSEIQRNILSERILGLPRVSGRQE